jgi:hypothetical protein
VSTLEGKDFLGRTRMAAVRDPFLVQSCPARQSNRC